jgi:transcriptional regulator with XRE-family HTH domain
MPRVHPVKVELSRRGLTQRSFASQVGISPDVLGHVLNGHAAPWPALRRRIAAELKQAEDELFPAEQAVTQ